MSVHERLRHPVQAGNGKPDQPKDEKSSSESIVQRLNKQGWPAPEEAMAVIRSVGYRLRSRKELKKL